MGTLLQRQRRGLGIGTVSGAHVGAVGVPQPLLLPLLPQVGSGLTGGMGAAHLIHYIKSIAVDNGLPGNHIPKVGVEMEFPKHRGLISQFFNLLCPQIRLRRQNIRRIVPRPRGVGIFSRHHADSGRDTKRRRCGAVCKANSLRRNSVPVGGAGRSAHAAHNVTAKLVGHNKQDVGLFFHLIPLQLPRF